MRETRKPITERICEIVDLTTRPMAELEMLAQLIIDLSNTENLSTVGLSYLLTDIHNDIDEQWGELEHLRNQLVQIGAPWTAKLYCDDGSKEFRPLYDDPGEQGGNGLARTCIKTRVACPACGEELASLDSRCHACGYSGG